MKALREVVAKELDPLYAEWEKMFQEARSTTAAILYPGHQMMLWGIFKQVWEKQREFHYKMREEELSKELGLKQMQEFSYDLPFFVQQYIALLYSARQMAHRAHFHRIERRLMAKFWRQLRRTGVYAAWRADCLWRIANYRPIVNR